MRGKPLPGTVEANDTATWEHCWSFMTEFSAGHLEVSVIRLLALRAGLSVCRHDASVYDRQSKSKLPAFQFRSE